jgi:deazaflavin-dependent oxidoreductase (nitroreductase family)
VLGERVARFNKRFLNRITVRVAPWAPGFGVVTHVGRRSGRTYRTPVNVLRDHGEIVLALTYGTGTDWLKNVEAAGGCELTTRGRTVRLDGPRVVHDESRRAARPPVRQILTLLDVADFVYFDRLTPPPAA